MDAEIADKEQKLESAKNEMMEAMNRLVDAKSNLSRFETMKSALAERLSAIDGEEAEARRKADGLKDELAAADANRQSTDRKHEEHLAAFREAQHNRLRLEAGLQALSAEVSTAEQNAGALSSREHVLREMMRSHEGYQNSVKLLMQAADRDESLRSCMIGPVAELLRVPKEYETAIGMSLGGSMQNIVTNTAEEARTIIEYARKNDIGRVTRDLYRDSTHDPFRPDSSEPELFSFCRRKRAKRKKTVCRLACRPPERSVFYPVPVDKRGRILYNTSVNKRLHKGENRSSSWNLKKYVRSSRTSWIWIRKRSRWKAT